MYGGYSVRIIAKSKLYGGTAKLVLLDDKTVQIVYNGELIQELKGNTWSNIENDMWAQKSVLHVVVESYIIESESDRVVKELAEIYFSEEE